MPAPSRRHPVRLGIEVLEDRLALNSALALHTAIQDVSYTDPFGPGHLSPNGGPTFHTLPGPAQVRVALKPQHFLSVDGKQGLTIQQAIDRVTEGGTVSIGPGEYTETLTITKAVRLVGQGAIGSAKIIGADPNQPVVTFAGPGAGGEIRNLTLMGGSCGVAGVLGSTRVRVPTREPGFPNLPQAGSPPAPLELTNVTIRDTGRGISGSFSTLALQSCTVRDTRDFGIRLYRVRRLEMLNSTVSFCGKGGLVIDNHTLGGRGDKILVQDSVVNSNAGLGIAVRGHGRPITISRCHVDYNHMCGIYLEDVGEVLIEDSSISFTRETADSIGQGLVVYTSKVVQLLHCDLLFNDFGIIVIGGADEAHRTYMELGDNAIQSNMTDIAASISGTEHWLFLDLGGNTCSLDNCGVAAGGVSFPDELSS